MATRLLVLTTLVLALAAASAAAATRATSTATGLRKAHWGANVTTSYGTSTIRYRSNGLPNHARAAYYAVPSGGAGPAAVPTAASAMVMADPSRANPIDVRITSRPRRAASVTAAPQGAIGVMISGAVLFNPYEGDGMTVALSSNFSLMDTAGDVATFVDRCNGHPGPGGQYHYHGLPSCVTAEVDKPAGASHLIGLAYDGFPIYGSRDIDGRTVPVSELDACNGITSPTPEFPKGIYHYVLPATTDRTSSIRCFRGSVPAALTQHAGAGPMAGPPMAAAR